MHTWLLQSSSRHSYCHVSSPCVAIAKESAPQCPNSDGGPLKQTRSAKNDASPLLIQTHLLLACLPPPAGAAAAAGGGRVTRQAAGGGSDGDAGAGAGVAVMLAMQQAGLHLHEEAQQIGA